MFVVLTGVVAGLRLGAGTNRRLAFGGGWPIKGEGEVS